jgi:hypothetical protein
MRDVLHRYGFSPYGNHIDQTRWTTPHPRREGRLWVDLDDAGWSSRASDSSGLGSVTTPHSRGTHAHDLEMHLRSWGAQ